MHFKNQAKFHTVSKVILVVSLLCFVFLAEPQLREKFTFAITYFDSPKANYESLTTDTINEAIHSVNPGIPEKSRAPEPSTFFLLLSGFVGVVARFAQKSFRKFKRASDYFLAIIGLTIASPILAFAAALIKLTSKGPIIYKQNRVGENGKVFKIYKLRTMCMDAEKETGAVWAKENDPRITPVGKVLRRLHIDEIPQLLNVIKGEMSIVGPRPERPEIVRDLKTLILDYEKRLQVRPGITGLAQIYHKYDETIADVRKKMKFDLLYIKKMCWLVEMRILAQTFVVALTGKGAR